jgi:epoxyqueuosine reductase
VTATSADLKRDITAYARSMGFERLGVTTPDPLLAAEKSLETWLDNGHAGDMDYMAKNRERRGRPGDLLPGAKSVIALAVNYYNGASPTTPKRGGPPSPGGRGNDNSMTCTPLPPGEGLGVRLQGRVARYAWGQDYHRVIEKRLGSLVRYIEALSPDARCKTFLDTGPLLERAAAQKAGLGFIGKNTMVITRGMGSWIFLASILTTLELPVDSSDTRSCGSCTLCIDACPTQAITQPYQLDARRCISYLTIESKGSPSEELSAKTGDWLFGCDICQDVCPHNTRVPLTPIPEFKPEAGVGPFLDIEEVLALKTNQDFDARFSGTPLKRAKREGLQRNARLVAENQKRTDHPAIKSLPSPA